MYRKQSLKQAIVLTMSLCLSWHITLTAFATPSAPQKQELDGSPEKVVVAQIGEDRGNENPTGLTRKLPGNPSLKEDIVALLPYLESVLNTAYSNAEEEVRKKIMENGWDGEVTMTSFHELGNPYHDVDYIKLIAAYATVVEEGRNGNVLLSDVPFIVPECKQYPLDEEHNYAEVSFKILDSEGLFRFYGHNLNDNPELKSRYEKRIQVLRDALRGTDVRQQMFIETPESIQNGNLLRTPSLGGPSIYDYDIPSNLSPERQILLATALSLVGKVPYDWGGKPNKAGYDDVWWTFDPSDGRQRGLDCSGFVQWAFMTAGYGKGVTNKLLSTYSIRENLEDISKEDLIPGDIGLLKNNSEGTNHTGIYLGNGKWVHCTSGKIKTVTVNDGCFHYYKRAPVGEADLSIGQRYLEQTGGNRGGFTPIQATDADVYMLAQLMEHEVGGEEYNAWVAVGEVVCNRVKSELFPNTLKEVIYQPHQFSYVQEIASITPRQKMIDTARHVLDGSLRYFGKENILYFRATWITSGISPAEPVDWGHFPWAGYVGATAFYTEN